MTGSLSDRLPSGLSRLRQYAQELLRSAEKRVGRTNLVASVAGIAFLTSWATVHAAWGNIGLWFIAAVAALTLPYLSRLANAVDDKLCFLTARILPGMLGRFSVQAIYNLVLLGGLLWAGVIELRNLEPMGGPVGTVLWITAAGQGLQLLLLRQARRKGHDGTRAVVWALTINAFASAIGALGLPFVSLSYALASLAVWAWAVSQSALSDYRSIRPRRGGIAVFFGTFNPVHVTHIELIRSVIRDREVRKVIVHPTLIPKAHRDALQRGEIREAGRKNGFLQYERTEIADPHVNYFPTGNRFLDPIDRKRLFELAINDAGLSDRAEVAWFPDAYQADGFTAVFAMIRRQYPNDLVHVIHGSDWGGMTVRRILDGETNCIPYSVRRTNKVSATAIRAGNFDYLTPSVKDALLSMS